MSFSFSFFSHRADEIAPTVACQVVFACDCSWPIPRPALAKGMSRPQLQTRCILSETTLLSIVYKTDATQRACQGHGAWVGGVGSGVLIYLRSHVPVLVLWLPSSPRTLISRCHFVPLVAAFFPRRCHGGVSHLLELGPDLLLACK